MSEIFTLKGKEINAGKVIAQIHLLNMPLLFKLGKKNQKTIFLETKRKRLKKIRAAVVAAIKWF